jgi:hypothetical protein
MPSACAGNIRKHVLGIFRYPAVEPIAFSNSVGLSAAPNDRLQQFRWPIHRTE